MSSINPKYPVQVRAEVDRLIATGAQSKAIADALGLDPGYVRSQKQAWRLRQAHPRVPVVPDPEVVAQIQRMKEEEQK